jgi:hypothetical protein
VFFIFIVILVLVWAVVPDAWHPYVPEIVLGAGLCGVIVSAFRIWGDLSRYGHHPLRAEYHWRPGVTAEAFETLLTITLRDRGWHILSSAVLDRERLGLTIQKDKQRVALLCLAPGHPPTAADIRYANASRVHAEAQTGVLLAGTHEADQSLLSLLDRNNTLLDYDNLSRLDLVAPGLA